MPLSIDKLTKFFRLEAERGFDNRAIVGGLNKILSWWEAEARAENLPEEKIQAAIHCLNTYPTLEPQARQDALKALWRTLQITREENPVALNAGQRIEPPGHRASHKIQHRQERASRPEDSQRKPVREPVETQKQAARPMSRQRPQANQSAGQALATGEEAGFNAPLTVIDGIGPRHAEHLADLGLRNLGDLLYFFPRRYDDYSKLKPINRLVYGEVVTVLASVQNCFTRPVRGGSVQLTEAVVSDGSGSLRLNWFNQPWIANQLRAGTLMTISGKVDQFLGRPVISNPEFETIDQDQLNTNRIVPVYSLTARLSQRFLRKIMHQTVSYWAPRTREYLPESIRLSAELMELPAALFQAHFPDTFEKLKAARQRLAFDEIFFLQLGVQRQKRAWQAVSARIFETPLDWLDAQIAQLPFELTNAQRKAVRDLTGDLASGHPMNRLIQGDVGSGKTVVAALGIAMVARDGCQTAVMAPTSILAEQHFRSLTRLLCGEEEGALLKPGEIALLLGDTSAADKSEIRAGLESGAIKLVIGTHALIESPVVFKDLQFVVVDEQHRFGVAQRAALRAKGTNPHLLVMTATPIPRSLALTVYGDLDLTVMDEMPAGRQVIETHVLAPRERERAYTLIRSQVEQGRQAFVIYPLVEQGDDSEAKAAVEEHARLSKEVFPTLALGLLHGRLRPEEKDSVMQRFHSGEYHILVSTSVVEVGVDVPNATVMLVEGANRFGLAQLHQFRGRVGRGEAKSYCLLVPENDDALENERLSAMAETNDGFVLAERDLEQRGPGDFLGTRQSGYAELQMATLTDVRLIEKARHHAQMLFNIDPDLQQPEHAPLVQVLQRFWRQGEGDIS